MTAINNVCRAFVKECLKNKIKTEGDMTQLAIQTAVRLSKGSMVVAGYKAAAVRRRNAIRHRMRRK